MSILYEKSNTGDDTYGSIGGDVAWWEGQTFTPSITHLITSIKLYLYKDAAAPGTLTVSIRATSASLPTGADLCSGTYNANTLTGTPVWTEISLGNGTLLAASTKYAFVMRVSAATDQARNRATNPGTYASGSAVYSGDSGATWTDYGTFDYQFEEYGGSSYPADPLLRVSGIVRTFWAGVGGNGVYQAQLVEGGMSTTYVSPISSRETQGIIPRTTPTPSGAGFQPEDYEKWLVSNDIEVILKFFGHFPSYQDWLNNVWRLPAK